MTGCNGFFVTEHLADLIRRLIKTAREVVVGLLSGIAGLIRGIGQWIKSFCGSWPIIGWLCSLIAALFDAVADAIDWIAQSIFGPLFDVIEAIVEVVLYVVRWLVWVLHWSIRLVDMAFCAMAALPPRRYMALHVRILRDQSGNLVAPVQTVESWMQAAKDLLLAECDIELSWDIIETPVPDEVYNRTMKCDAGAYFTSWYGRLDGLADPCVLTVFIVNDLDTSTAGCFLPGSTWVMVDMDRAGTPGQAWNILHEIAHACDHFHHTSGSTNLMHAVAGPQISKFQCCLMYTSRWTSLIKP